MNWTIEKIKKSLGDKLIGSVFMQQQVCKALQLLPVEITEKVCKTVWFISSPDDSWALTFRGSDVKDGHLIFVSDELLRQDDAQIKQTIIHEVGHVILSHRNSVGYMQTDAEIKQQEKDANEFAEKYVS